jgi:hypothetical protein
MRSLAFLSVVIALLFCVRTNAQTTPAPDSIPKAYKITAVAIKSPISGEASCTRLRTHGEVGLMQGLRTRGGRMKNDDLVLGVVDMVSECTITQLEATVPNGHKVGIQLQTKPGDTCTATPTFKSDPKPDYLSTITSFLKPTLIFGVKEYEATPTEGTATEQRIAIPPAANGTMTVPIVCNSTPGPQPRTVVIHYKNPPQFSASAGTLVSLYGKHVYGFTTSQTGVSSTGVATTQNTTTLTTSNVQLVPIGFLNTYISGTNRLHLDLQAGLGINPNGSKTAVEYFFGPALTMHGIYFAPGLYIARASYLGGGFSLGEVIPSGVTPPVNYRATYRFAFAISYSPPVKSGN